MNMKPDFMTYLRRWMIFISVCSTMAYVIVMFNTDYFTFKLKSVVSGLCVGILYISLKLALDITKYKKDKKADDKIDLP